MATLFISDLHLEAGRPDITQQFLSFLRGPARDAEALYILGDLFEVWIGDDDPDPYVRDMTLALNELVTSGVPSYFIHGNRDFLIAGQFSTHSGVELLPEAVIADLYGQRVLLMHGDTLCTDDAGYQSFRSMVRDPEWQSGFRALPVAQRRAMAREARDASRAHNQASRPEIMDVNQGAVEQALDEHDVTLLLHGHTHRPGIHRFAANGRPCTRIVLGDWYDQGSMLTWSAEGFDLQALPRGDSDQP